MHVSPVSLTCIQKQENLQKHSDYIKKCLIPIKQIVVCFFKSTIGMRFIWKFSANLLERTRMFCSAYITNPSSSNL